MATSQNRGLVFLQQAKLFLEETSSKLQGLKSALETDSLFIVGGFLRDSLLGLESKDIDLTTNLAPEQVTAKLKKSGFRVIETGLQHGTVTAILDIGPVEITSFRKRNSNGKFELGSSIEEDLSARDFSINSIAWSVSHSQLVDPFKGQEDLANNFLRCVSKPKDVLADDPLRILRAIRFGPASKRSLDSELILAISEQVADLNKISVERIKAELDKILLSELPAEGFRALQKLGALSFTVPELIPAVGFEQNEFHMHDVFEHSMWVLERSEKDLDLRWAALFHDVGKPHTLSVDEKGRRHFYKHEQISEQKAYNRLTELRASNQQIKTVSLLVKEHMRPLICNAPGVRRIIRDLAEELPRWLLLKKADSSPLIPESEVNKAFEHFNTLHAQELERRKLPIYGKLAVNGDDLKELGIKPGPEMGRILKALEEVVIENPEVNTKDLLVKEAINIFKNS